MALRQSPFPDGLQHPLPQAQQPQFVGDGALAFSQSPGRLLLGKVPPLHKTPDALGLLDKIQILPLQVLHQSGKPRFLVVHPHNEAGHFTETCLLGGPEPPLPGNQFIVAPHPPDGKGLENSMALNTLGQILQRLLGKNFSGLSGIGQNGLGRQKYHPSRLHIGF